MLRQVDTLSLQISEFEQRLKDLVEITLEMQLLMSLPGVGVILAATLHLGIGEIGRFPSAECLELCRNHAARAACRTQQLLLLLPGVRLLFGEFESYELCGAH